MASLKKWRDRRRNPWKAVFYDAFRDWKRESGQLQMNDYSALPRNSVVFDIGGFRGEWTDLVRSQCNSARVHIFEPHPEFAARLSRKYSEITSVHVHGFALGAKAGSIKISDAGDASSAVADHQFSFESPVVPLEEFFLAHDVTQVDLAKMNIEGGEYDLLAGLIATGLIKRIATLQVQFHLFEPGMIRLRDAIREQLRQTHDCKWSYPFVWECWQRR
jgi:FkbM family methyltransferase